MVGVAPEAPSMPTDDLATWLVGQFGVRDERLVTLLPLDDHLAELATVAEDTLERVRRRVEERQTRYERLLGRGLPAEGPQRTAVLAKAERAQDAVQAYRSHLVRLEERAAAVAVLQALRGTGDGVPGPMAAERPVRKRLAGAGLPLERLVPVRAALAIDDPDPLVWVPVGGFPERTDEDPAELMADAAESELEPSELNELDDFDEPP
jgi:hypothetical protein